MIHRFYSLTSFLSLFHLLLSYIRTPTSISYFAKHTNTKVIKCYLPPCAWVSTNANVWCLLWGHGSIKSSSVLSGYNSCETGQINCCLNKISHLLILAKICLCVSFWGKKRILRIRKGKKNKVWGGKKFSFCAAVCSLFCQWHLRLISPNPKVSVHTVHYWLTTSL